MPTRVLELFRNLRHATRFSNSAELTDTLSELHRIANSGLAHTADWLTLDRYIRNHFSPARRRHLLTAITSSATLNPAQVALRLPALEPVPRGPLRFETLAKCEPINCESIPGDKTFMSKSLEPDIFKPHKTQVRQGRLGDCWLIATLGACEITQPGFTNSLLAPIGDGLVRVNLKGPLAKPVIVTNRLPVRHRAGDTQLKPNAASLVEKAVAATFGRGRYRGIQNNFAGIAYLLLTGHWCPARPLPGIMQIQDWLSQGRPVVASTLLRRQSVRLLPREDSPKRSVAFLTGHVYMVVGVKRVTEDGQKCAHAPLRVHVRNPLLDPETEPRRTNLYLSEAQFKKAFLSVNVGPQLTKH